MFQADDSDDDEGEEVSEVDLLQVRMKKRKMLRNDNSYLHISNACFIL